MFSERTPPDLVPNRLSQAVAETRRAGRSIIDLTESNPTRAGFEYPRKLLAAMSAEASLVYAPAPFGAIEARRAVARDYARQGLAVPPQRIVLTASTSEAYSLLFKLLADAGDEVLVPRPSYPLFEHLTRLDLVAARPYTLEYHGRWSIDFDSVERALAPRTRAVLIVSPNNPTGSFITPDDLARLAALCAARGVAIIADEVFSDYELVPGALSRAGRAAGQHAALAFALGGLSKSAGLPQVKLGWIAAGGPPALVDEALARLEVVCDAYLSVSTPVQVAAPELIDRAAAVRSQIAARVRSNFDGLRRAVASVPSCRVLEAEGGWYGVLQVPSLESEDDLVVRLLEEFDVLVHPGYFFDFLRESYLIVSLLPPPGVFGDGIARILRHFACSSAA